ncbi:MAG: hypothetical protein LBJ96_00320 [Holosporaceae bacterium]|jgi:hypothetical protein|nr:hypothetical protein [Holosporaceae bacterium]
MKNIRILAGVLACVGSMSATALQTRWPYGFDEGVLEESEGVLPTANRHHVDWVAGETNRHFLHFYFFPFLSSLLQEIEGKESYCSGLVTEAPAIEENHRTFFEKLGMFEQELVSAINVLPQQPEIPFAQSQQDLGSFRAECNQIADALPFPRNICTYIRDVINDAAEGNRVCIASIHSIKELGDFREKNNLLPCAWGYSHQGVINSISGEIVPDAVSVAFHESGHAAAHHFFNCANVGEVFSLFFQVAAFSTAVNTGNLTKIQAQRIVREFLLCMFSEVKIINFNKKICEDKFSTKEGDHFDVDQHINSLCGTMNLIFRERLSLINSFLSSMKMVRGEIPRDSGHYGFSLICALTEYIDFEKKLESTPDDQKEKLFYYHLTRLKLLFEKPILWKAYFLTGDKVEKAIEYLQQKINEAPAD